MNVKKIMLIIVTFMIIFLSNINVEYALSYDYEISSYDVDMVVNEDNTIEITEKIEAKFNVPRHGIYRKIPLKNSSSNINDINVDDEFITYNENGYKVIKIGNENKTITDNKSYTISYVYDLGKDNNKNYDELYFNIIGNEWDTRISNISFSITMPKEFDKSKLEFFSGQFGSTDGSNIKYNVDGNQISGYLDGTLNSYEGLSVRLELPDGYFTYITKPIELNETLYIPIIFLFITYIMWYKYGKDEKIENSLEFYPPEGLNSAEVGYLNDGIPYLNHITSLLVYLANKGYIKIIEIEETYPKSFKIVKLKDYDGNNLIEKVFFDGLFKSCKDKSNGAEVTDKDLKNKFYITNQKIMRILKSKKYNKKYYEHSTLTTLLKGIVILMSVISYAIILINLIKDFGIETESIILCSAIVLIGTGIVHFFLGKVKSVFSAISIVVFSLVVILVSLMPIVIKIIEYDQNYLINFSINILCIFNMNILLALMPKRNKYANEVIGKIYGFKKFLETSEKSRLEMILGDDPMYFYKMLPYAYALGVLDKWINKFYNTPLPMPDWYVGINSFDYIALLKFVNSTISYVINPRISKLSKMLSSGGSRSSGGGFSGGGSGGGGGGSW